MTAYYNEIDPFAAEWLRNLIGEGRIAPGKVDERSIVDVQASDLEGFTQCHFFAGIGIWSYALRCAGWADDRPVWTGSCPCQPFSAAGKGNEFADERHLWPAWFKLLRQFRPVSVFGEQVASRDALAWLDHVCADLEGEGYAVGAVDTCAAGYGAPHIRQRLYWMADSDGAECGLGQLGLLSEGGNGDGPAGRGEWQVGAMDDAEREQEYFAATRGLHAMLGKTSDLGDPSRRGCGISGDAPESGRGGYVDGAGIMGDSAVWRPQGSERERGKGSERISASTGERCATNGFWSDAEWLPCRDGKARPTEPGTFPLAHGSTQRVGRLRAYGNCIVAPQAEEFIRAYMMLDNRHGKDLA